MQLLVSVYTYVGGSWSTHKVTTVWGDYMCSFAAKEERKEKEEEEANCRCFMPSVWWPKEPVAPGD